MRYDSEHKARTRERVLAEAGKAIREGGVENLGVAGVMKAAGLTHGGFYAHFKSREDLLTAAIGEMVAGVQGRLQRHLSEAAPAEGLAAWIDFYLSPGHRDATGGGCPLPVLSSDMSRMSVTARKAFADAVAKLAATLTPPLAALGRPEPGTLAASIVSEAVGALALARAVGAGPESDLILTASRRLIAERAGLFTEPAQ